MRLAGLIVVWHEVGLRDQDRFHGKPAFGRVPTGRGVPSLSAHTGADPAMLCSPHNAP